MATRFVEPGRLDLGAVLRPGDRIAWSQACAEPLPRLHALVEQAAAVGGLEGFCGLSLAPELARELAGQLTLTSYGALGALRELAAAGTLAVVPCHFSALPALLTRGELRCDVAFVQVSEADAEGRHSLGVGAEYVHDVALAARVVVAEVNEQLPATPGAHLPAERIDLAVRTSRPLPEAPASPAGEADAAIAAHVAALVDDGDCVQIGVGGVPTAVLRALRGHRDLGIHSGFVSDPVVDLVEAGVVTGARKRRDTGVVVLGAALGSQRLFSFLDGNPLVRLEATSYTHRADVIAGLGPLVAINSALEVDLGGQVGAEAAGGRYVGAVGGQVDFGRGALASGGRSVIALPSRTRAGRPTIVPALSGPVTTPRSDADLVVTEHGVASLRGLDLARRARALIGIAHPDDREELAASLAHGTTTEGARR